MKLIKRDEKKGVSSTGGIGVCDFGCSTSDIYMCVGDGTEMVKSQWSIQSRTVVKLWHGGVPFWEDIENFSKLEGMKKVIIRICLSLSIFLISLCLNLYA